MKMSATETSNLNVFNVSRRSVLNSGDIREKDMPRGPNICDRLHRAYTVDLPCGPSSQQRTIILDAFDLPQNVIGLVTDNLNDHRLFFIDDPRRLHIFSDQSCVILSRLNGLLVTIKCSPDNSLAQSHQKAPERGHKTEQIHSLEETDKFCGSQCSTFTVRMATMG